MIAVTMHFAIDSTDAGARADAEGSARVRRSPIGDAFLAVREQRKKFRLGGSAQPFEKARSGQGNPRKSKPFSWIFFAPPLPGFARLG
jgi:hypothetical protein